MKYLILLTISVLSIAPCTAQYMHIPDIRAKMINDKAVNKYITYGQRKDSVVAAIKLLDKALAIDNNYYNAWTNKLGFQCHIGAFRDALATATKMNKLFPEQVEVLLYSGVLQYKLGNIPAGDNALTKMLNDYKAIPDTSTNSEHLKTQIINKAVALKLLKRDKESKDLLDKLSNSEHDPTVKKYINSYNTKNRGELINEMIPGK